MEKALRLATALLGEEVDVDEMTVEYMMRLECDELREFCEVRAPNVSSTRTWEHAPSKHEMLVIVIDTLNCSRLCHRRRMERYPQAMLTRSTIYFNH